MIVSEIGTRVKRAFGDESGVQITDSDIVRWINDGMRDLAFANNLLEVKATAAVTAGTATYSTPSDMLSLRSVKYLGVKLRGLSIQEVDSLFPQIDDPNNQANGNPLYFYMFAGQLSLYPVPQTSGPADLILYYVRRPSLVVAQADTPELPVQYHQRLVEYCLMQAYELDEDWAGSQQKAKQFMTGINNMNHDDTWTDQEKYPRITVMAEDAGDGAYGYYA